MLPAEAETETETETEAAFGNCVRVSLRKFNQCIQVGNLVGLAGSATGARGGELHTQLS